MENKPKSIIECLFDAIKTINDNLLILSENLAETHEKVAKIESVLIASAEPISSGAAKPKK